MSVKIVIPLVTESVKGSETVKSVGLVDPTVSKWQVSNPI